MTEPFTAQASPSTAQASATGLLTAPSIVVGIDGSPAANYAARWAVDEAISRDLPLRLVAVSAPADAHHAQKALTDAAEAVAATSCDVDVQTTAVVAETPAHALLEAARDALMICVGGAGMKHVHTERVRSGSNSATAAALVASAHCPVAVVRGPNRPGGWVVVELDGTADSAAVLQYGVEEARLRQAPLKVLGTWQANGNTAEDAERMLRAHLDRRLEQWQHRYPDLDVVPVAVHNSGLDYLTENAAAIQLVVVGCRNTRGVDELLGRYSNDCTVLVIDPQRLL